MRERMTTARVAAYGLGNAGFQITDRIVVAITVYFYLPPAGRGLDVQVPSRVFLGFLTVYGVAMLLGRIVDSLADPVVGHLSDRSRSRLGRRRVFLVWSIVPMVGLPVALFWPPAAPGSWTNGLWLAVVLAAYFVAFTGYVGPYLALIPELARTQLERVKLARTLALIGFPAGAGFGTLWTLWYELGRDAGLAPAGSIRTVVVLASLVALALCVAPIAAVDESRFARGVPSDLSFRHALGATFANRPFRLYLASQLAFIFGFNLIQPVLPYIATVLLGRSEAFASWLGLAAFGGIGLGFASLRVLVDRTGPKGAMMASTAVFGLALMALGALRADVPGGPHDAANLAIAFAACSLVGLPVAALMVLPHVLIGQLIDYDATRTGANRSAMYFGMQGFLTKWMYGVSLWVLTVLLSRFGASPDQAGGVILVGPVAGAACLLSLVPFARYPERELLDATRAHGGV